MNNLLKFQKLETIEFAHYTIVVFAVRDKPYLLIRISSDKVEMIHQFFSRPEKWAYKAQVKMTKMDMFHNERRKKRA